MTNMYEVVKLATVATVADFAEHVAELGNADVFVLKTGDEVDIELMHWKMSVLTAKKQDVAEIFGNAFGENRAFIEEMTVYNIADKYYVHVDEFDEKMC